MIIYFLFLTDIKSGSGLESKSGIGFKYLTFLDFGLQTNIFRNVDDGTVAVGLPSALSIGNQSFHTLYVRFTFYNCSIIFCFLFR